MKTLDEKILELIELNSDGKDGFIFAESYSHTGKIMFKISNIYTHFRQEILVLCAIDEGFEHAVDLALEEIEKKRVEFYGEETKKALEEPECSCKVGEPYNNLCCDVHGKMKKL